MTPTATVIDTQMLGASLRLVVGRLARHLRRHHAGGLTPGEFSTLATAERHGPVRPSELAELEGVSPPTLSRLVARLEERRYLTRQGNPGDGRSSLIAVSDAGLTALESIRRERTALLATSLAALAAPDREAIAAALPALERLVEAVKRTEA